MRVFYKIFVTSIDLNNFDIAFINFHSEHLSEWLQFSFKLL